MAVFDFGSDALKCVYDYQGTDIRRSVGDYYPLAGMNLYPTAPDPPQPAGTAILVFTVFPVSR
jgi:hypothetical protein